MLLLVGLLNTATLLVAQTNTTEALHKRFGDALSLYFYKNTLRMLNQAENKDFDDAIKEIEKMKFLMIQKSDDAFGQADYKKLLSDYESEGYEGIMTSRYEGKNLSVYLRETDNITKGMIIVVNDSTNLYLLDMIGRVPLDKIGKLLSAIDDNADIGRKIRSFTGMDEGRDERDNKRRVH